MVSERELQETAARCVDCMVVYHNGRQTPKAKAAMVSEVRAIAVAAARMKPADKAADEPILKPVREGLLARYGPEAGRKLFTEFLEAFDGPPGSGPILSPSKV